MTPANAILPDAEEVTVRGSGRVALTFVAVALVALAVLPVYVSRDATVAQREITEVLEPAARTAAALRNVQVRQMTLFQSFLLTADPAYRLRYSSALAEERSLFERLDSLTRGMDLSRVDARRVRERLAQVNVRSTDWHFGHRRVLETIDPREAVQAADRQRNRRAFDAVEGSAEELELAIRGQVNAARQRMTRARVLLSRTTLGLGVLALGATVVVGFVGRRLRLVTAEAEGRRREADRARREITALMEATGDGVLGIGLDGRCISLNRAGTELLGWAEREIVGRDVHDTVHHTRSDGTPRDRAGSPILRAVSEASRGTSAEDDILWRKDGTSFPAGWTLRPLLDGLNIRGAVLTFTDMTETRAREHALERAVRAREEVMSVVSHDLRNPLGVVAAAADLLVDLPLTPEERRKQVEIIARSAVRMGRLIDDLLDVARLEAGALVMRQARVDAVALLDATTETFAPQAERRGVALASDVAPDTPPLLVDRERVLQALANLVSNALRHTSRGGRIDLRAGPCENGTAWVSVADTGAGIVPEALERLFDRFWRPSGADAGGAGLGLAIVKGVAEGLGGSVEVESEVGVGSVFTLLLPAADRSA